MTYPKNAEQDARLAKLETLNAEFLDFATQLVSEHKALRADLETVRRLNRANGIGLVKLERRVGEMELEGERS